MAATKISDVIVPEIFTPYLIQKTVEKSAFLNSGIASSDPNVVITKGGRTVNIPFWKNLTGTTEVLSDSASLTVNNITSAVDIAAIHARGVAYGVNSLAELFSGDDPMAAIGNKLADNWAVELEKVLINTLTGVFGVAAMAKSINDQSTNVLTADIMTDSMFLLGDNFSQIRAIAMHSMVLAKLKKLDLVEDFQPSDLSPSYSTYMGKRIIVDDALAPVEGVYNVYFFADGAIAYNENAEFSTLKTDEDILADESVIASRRVFTMHPRGVKWVGTAAGATPSNTELATASNWALVDDRKNVGLSLLKVKVSA